MKRFLYVVTLILCLATVGCKKDEIILYNDITFVTATDGEYISDTGLKYIIVENASEREIPQEGRLIFACDILKKVRNGVYNIRVNNFSQPLTKDVIPASEDPVDDPVSIEDGWFSGGYFNTLLGLYRKDESDVKHLLNLEYTLPTESNDTLYLRLTHNAYGEVPAKPDDNTDEYSYVRTYACFKLADLLPSGTVAPVKILWNWFDKEAEDPAATREYFFKLKLKF